MFATIHRNINEPSLSISEPDDQYEQEADQVAKQVMRMKEGEAPIKRKCTQCEEEEFMQRKEAIGGPIIRKDLNKNLQGTKGNGTPMNGHTRQFMESRMGTDFSNVLIHTGNTSEKMNRDISARAFTHGSDIYFNRNEYQPESNSGKELLAHELTHVVQQKNSPKMIQRIPGETVRGTGDLHESLGRLYSLETGVPYTDGIQYTEGYAEWLAERRRDPEEENPGQVCLTASLDNPDEMICVDRPEEETEEDTSRSMMEALERSWESFMEYINERDSDVHFLILRLADALNEDDMLLVERHLHREDSLREEPMGRIARQMLRVRIENESLRTELIALTRESEPEEFEETAGRGESYYRDEVRDWSIERGDNRITGDVERSEYTSEEAFAHGERRIHFGRVSLELIQNEDDCVLRVPVTVNIVPHTEGIDTYCGDFENFSEADDVDTPDPDRFEEVRADYIRILNERLNGWYSVQLEEDCDELTCQDRNISIEVDVTESSTNPDYTVIVTDNRGRSYVSGSEVVLCARGLSEGTMWHEGGHMVLEHGDEYHEEGRPEQRVRTDMSLMGSHSSYGRFAVLHRRHFNFAKVFIEHITGCPATLREEPRPIQISFRPSLIFAGGSVGQVEGLYYSLGLEMGIPLDRLRRVEIILGPRLNLILGQDESGAAVRQLLLGLRAGIQGRVDPLLNDIPLTFGGYGEFGGVGITDLETGEFGTEPYVEGGLTLGGSMGEVFNFGIEAGVGTRFDSDEDSPYFRFGGYIGGSF